MRNRLKRIIIYTTVVLLLICGTAYLVIYRFRNEIRAAVLAEADKHISGKLGLEEVRFTFFKEFPKISVTLYNSFVEDSLSKHKIFQAEKIFLNASLQDIFTLKLKVSSIIIHNASVSVSTDATGHNDLQAFKDPNKRKSSDKPSKMPLEIQEIGFENVRFALIDSTKNKNHTFLFENVKIKLAKKSDTLAINLDGSVFFEGLGFNTKKGIFLENQATQLHLAAGFHAKSKTLSVPTSHVHVQGQDLILKGLFDLSKKPGSFQLTIRNENTDVETCKKFVTQTLQNTLKKYNLTAQVPLQLKLEGDLGSGKEPKSDLIFATENSVVKVDTLTFTEMKLIGVFSNHLDNSKPPGDFNSILQIPDFSGKIDGSAIKGKLKITDLTNPYLDLQASVSQIIKDTNDFFHKELYKASPQLLGFISKSKIEKPIEIDLTVKGRVAKTEGIPEVKIVFEIKESDISYKNYAFNSVFVHGTLHNRFDEKLKPSMKNTKMEVRDFHGKMQGSAVQADFLITDFVEPVIDLHTNFGIKLAEIQPFLSKKQPFLLNNGWADLKIEYAGKIYELMSFVSGRKPLKKLPGSLTGTMNIKDAKVYYTSQQLTFFPIHGNFTFDNDSLIINNLSGKITNQPFALKGKVAQLIPFVLYPDSNDPFLDLSVSFDATLKEVNSWLHTEKYRFETGSINMNAIYQGYLKNYSDEKNQKVKSKMWGNLTLKDGGFYYLPDDFRYSHLNGMLIFQEGDLEIRNLAGFFNQSPVLMQGKVLNLIPFFFYPNQRISANLAVSSSALDLNQIIRQKPKKYLLTKDIPVSKNPNLLKENFLDVLNIKTAGNNTIANKIDEITEKIQTVIQFNAEKAFYRQVEATELSGTLNLKTKLIEFSDVGLKTADGYLRMDGSVDISPNNFDKLSCIVTVKGVAVDKIFQEFENFNQTAISDKNLRGELHADIQFSADLLPSLKIMPESMKGNLYIRLYDGKLLDFEPLTDIQKVIFKKRDLEHIQFALIENNFVLNGVNLDIKKMAIESNVLGLFVEGTYSFAGDTDLSIQIPLKYILKRRKDFKTDSENIRTDPEKGANVFLRATSQNGKIRFSYDPLKKFRDKKEEKPAADKELVEKFKKLK